jgi:F-type H+-transporting ATPase subunit delta
MSTRGSASRYARALLDVAIKESLAERAEQDLAAFSALLTDHPDAQAALTHPAVPAMRKRALTHELTTRLSLSTPVAKLLAMLADRDRLSLVPELLEVYRERLLEHQQVVRAEITTAEPLAADREAELESRLARATGRRVTLTTRVDPALIGGVVTRIGSVVYDGSLATQLTRMRDRLDKQM